MRDVTIKKVMNGFTVQVGCQTLVFETQERMMGEIEKYLKNPQETEELYLKTYGMANQNDVAQERQACPPTPSYSYGCSTAVVGCGPDPLRR